jgi:hypothetical protein
MQTDPNVMTLDEAEACRRIIDAGATVRLRRLDGRVRNVARANLAERLAAGYRLEPKTR